MLPIPPKFYKQYTYNLIDVQSVGKVVNFTMFSGHGKMHYHSYITLNLFTTTIVLLYNSIALHQLAFFAFSFSPVQPDPTPRLLHIRRRERRASDSRRSWCRPWACPGTLQGRRLPVRDVLPLWVPQPRCTSWCPHFWSHSSSCTKQESVLSFF